VKRDNFLGPEVLDKSFARDVRLAWERFMSRDDRPGDSRVREVIRSSWERSRMEAVSPLAKMAPIAMMDDELRRHQRYHAELLEATRAVAATIEPLLHRSRSIMVVTDTQGMVLDTYGSNQLVELGAERHISPGGLWSEGRGGTNAIGTAITTGQAVQVHALEHYCEGVKSWTCAAALVREGHGNDLLGVIDISGPDDTFNMHSLALAMSSAAQIESILNGQEARALIQLLEWCNSRRAFSRDDGLIILDRKHKIVSANDRVTPALRRFGVTHAAVAGQLLPGARGGNVHAAAGKPPGSPLPHWMDPDWIQPVVIDGKTIGYTVVIPDRQTKAAQAPPDGAALQTAAPKSESAHHPFGKIVGASEGIRSAIERGRRLAIGDQPVLILGETGVGKEEFANALHAASRKRGGPFVAINCAALSRELVISELFGYVEGAFTGALRGGRPGKFEQANGGTLFLDEVGELPLDVQASLLRVLQDGVVTRMGENKARKIDVRIISATNRDLRDHVSRGLFREDLYYRLSVTTLIIPPLRMRQRDIPVLAEHFLHGLETTYSGTPKTISPALHQKLMTYTWPGNIRELKNVLESMWHLSDCDTLDVCHLPPEYGDDGKIEHTKPKPFNLREHERETIIRSIEEHNGNIRRAALALGIARSTLYEKMKTHGIRRAGVVLVGDGA